MQENLLERDAVPTDAGPAPTVARTAHAVVPRPLDALTPAQVLRGARIRLQAVPDDPPPPSPVTELAAPGLLQELVVVFKKQIWPVGPADLDRVGGAEVLWQKARANRSSVEALEGNGFATPEGGWFRTLGSGGPFLAARILEPSMWWEYHFRKQPTPLGLLAVAPADDVIGIHVIRDSRAAASIPGMAAFARTRARATARPLSSSVYWVHEHGAERVARWVDEATLERTGSTEFTQLLADLERVGLLQPRSREYGEPHCHNHPPEVPHAPWRDPTRDPTRDPWYEDEEFAGMW